MYMYMYIWLCFYICIYVRVYAFECLYLYICACICIRMHRFTSMGVCKLIACFYSVQKVHTCDIVCIVQLICRFYTSI